MLRILGKLLLLGLCTAIHGPVNASSNGLIMNDDTVGIQYVGNISHTVYHNSRLDTLALYSQGPDPRNLLFSAGLELYDFNIEFENKPPLSPKAVILFSDFLDSSLLSLAGGVAMQWSQTQNRKFDIWAEFYAAPPLTTLLSGKYLWSFKTQLDFPFHKQAAINFGYRKNSFKLDDGRETAFDQGFYFGLSTLF